MTSALTSQDVQHAWSALIENVRTAVLLTLRNGRPFGSHVPYVFGSDWTRTYLHLSRLALHTQHLLIDPRVSLFIAEPDGPEKNPLALRRLNLQGEAATLSPDAPSYDTIKEQYLARFPQSEMMFGFGDFALWELRLAEAHFVIGFGQAFVSTATTPARWVHQKVERPSTKKE
ncbi:MAG: pyridoxamine 5'-phosphate oxidase family protein [Nitrospira sp.]|nr:pyridoxamine 5'-phosphate oxidase family protein [Nitrospira sp.]MDH4369280.1 pyridoxamine 5'-phosphate oxidase family protein [Nitrospira sp.]MDH5347393.1 pyridoxamine 5'-phosphate oxidase family protein [Nitrospira sp.]MDH5496026.1 pyridoxamine 5'-phosphate oxidase family protein [Nitrospira sp.]MDH5726060.1 pyridoxamine 5'-phosphate oxidase family protein [Nitrospira sp.]